MEVPKGKPIEAFWYTDEEVDDICETYSQEVGKKYEVTYEGGVVKFTDPDDPNDEVWMDELFSDRIVIYPTGYQYFNSKMAAIVIEDVPDV